MAYRYVQEVYMTRFRKVAALLALTVALAFPTSALAATTTSPVTESFTATQSVSLTAPAAITYTYAGGGVVTGAIALTNISSTFTASNTVLSLARTNSASGTAFGLSTTSAAATVAPTTGWSYTDIVAGGGNALVTINAYKTLATKAGDVATSTGSIAMSISGVTTVGSWTGSLNIQLTQN